MGLDGKNTILCESKHSDFAEEVRLSSCCDLSAATFGLWHHSVAQEWNTARE